MSSQVPTRHTFDAAKSSPLRGLCVWLFAAVTMALAGAASGTPFVTYVVSCEAAVLGSPGSGASDCASVSNFFSPTPTTVSDNAFFSTVASAPFASGNAAASYVAVADFGHLGIGFTAAAVSETHQTGCAPGIICESPLSIANSASAVSFADDILIQSSSLAIGTPVTIGFAFPLTGTLDISAFGGLNAPQASGNISVGYGFSDPTPPASTVAGFSE